MFSLVVICCTTCYHSLYHSLSFFVFYCRSLYYSLPLVFTRYSFQNVCKNLINNQMQLSRGVLQKSCSEIFRKILRKTSTVDCCDFGTKITLHTVCFPVNFQKTFIAGVLHNTSGQLLPNNVGSTKNWKNEQIAQRRLIKRIL